jgi:hypothetical protein
VVFVAQPLWLCGFVRCLDNLPLVTTIAKTTQLKWLCYQKSGGSSVDEPPRVFAITGLCRAIYFGATFPLCFSLWIWRLA